MNKTINKIIKKAITLNIDDNSKLVIMSDCHRGNGSNYDNFLKNENVYNYALNHYFKEGFTYIELGDGDDMWEVVNYDDIIKEHLDTYKLMKKFYDNERLIMIYGNHDICKRSKKLLQKYFYSYYDEENDEEKELFNNLIVYESLIMNYNNQEIYLFHGHQVDLLNGKLWRLSKFLVRYVWRFLEHFSFKEVTGNAKNYEVTKSVEKKLNKWSLKNNKILITGHTHRPIFPEVGESLYFNDGSCVHPSGITCIEIENGNITLVKWKLKLEDNKLTFKKEKLDASKKLTDYKIKKKLN